MKRKSYVSRKNTKTYRVVCLGLDCRKVFTSESKFLRLCPSCTRANNQLGGRQARAGIKRIGALRSNSV